MFRFTAVSLTKTTVRRRTVSAAAAVAAAATPTTTAPPRPTISPAATAQTNSTAAPSAATTTAPAVTPPVLKKKIVKKVVRKKVSKTASHDAASPSSAPHADDAAHEATAIKSKPSNKAMRAKEASERVNTGEDLRRELRGISSAVNTDRSADSTGTTTTPSDHKTAMVKGYKIEEVLSLCSSSDAIFARRLPAGGCQFFAWPGTSLEVASAAIVSMPDTIRTVHAVFGRRHTPIDLVMDVDCAVPKEAWSMSKIRPFQQKVLDDVLSVVSAELDKIGEKVERQVVLQSPNLKKASFHIHTRLKDAAFADYESVHGFLARFHDKIPTVDLQIYRTNGMLRMFSCMKENRTSAMTVMENCQWNVGFKDGRVPPEQAALLSVCVRDAGSFSRVLTYRAPWPSYGGAGAARGATADDADGDAAANGAPGRARPVVPVLIPRNAAEAIENASTWLRHATEVEVGEWRSWIGLGLCAFRVGYHFRDAPGLERPAMEQMLKAWEEASRHCPHKYRNGECAERWATFDATKLTQESESGWWGGYKRLGRLQWAAQEALKAERASKASKRK